ncbi:uncharacterized protein itprid1 [Thunnus albacares]|uniref:uncharacterized protein itprid1 n=1 Tax=Thunnus albacares TaxID=8236 RepID=UPI001CF66CE8|nr:uncharacterized protein itprid1 [Thunnus albacares]
MTSEGAAPKRANLVASRVHWSHMDLPEPITAQNQQAHGSTSQDSVREWLTTTITEGDAKHEPLTEAVEPLRRNPSSDDDLALGVEASLYGKQGVRTVQEFLRWRRSHPALSRWNSLSSATSGHSGPLSVMDILNLWNDDPEEVLLDLGFGCDEPDLSGRIPARFINHQSQARGINLQVFLEAQKNRLDLENPDVSNRFRQLEVLQQVTTAFSSLVGSSSSSSLFRAPPGKDLAPEARERRKRMGMLLRRASKKSQSQICHSPNTQDPTTPPATTPPSASTGSLQLPPSLGDEKVPLKRVKPGLQETVCLSPLVEEQGASPDPQLHMASFNVREGALRHRPLREGYPLTANTFLQRKKSPGQAKESFEMEEIHSFDESSVTGSYAGGADNLVRGMIRTNSGQSDSSGFLEEPFIPSLPQLQSPGPDLFKALSGQSGGSTDSQSSERPSSPSPPSPLPPTSSFISSAVDKSLVSSPCTSPEPPLVPPYQSLVSSSLPTSNLQSSEMETAPDQNQSPPNPPASLPALVCEYPLPHSSSPKLLNLTHSQSSALPFPASFTFLPSTSPPFQDASVIGGSEEFKTALSPPSSLNLDSSVSIATSSTQSDPPSGGRGDTRSEQMEVFPSPSLPDFHYPPSLAFPPIIESPLKCPEDNEKDSLFPVSDGIDLSEPPTDTQKEEEETPSSLSFPLDKEDPSAPSSLVLGSSKSDEDCPTLPHLSPNQTIPVCQPALSSPSHDPDGLIDSAVGRISNLTEPEQSISQQDRPCPHDDNTDPAPASPVQDVIHIKMDHLSVDLEDTLQRNEKGEGEDERHSYTVQTQESVYISDTESSASLSEGSRLVSEEVCYETEIGPQVPSCSLHELSAETKQEEFSKVSQVKIDNTESKSPRSYLVLHDEAQEARSRTEVEASDLIEIESLDLVFETSVDGSEGEYGDVDAFFQQIDTEGRVYWAEPIQVSSTTPVLGESGSIESSDAYPENTLFPRGSAVLDSFSSTGKATPLSSSFSTTMDTGQASLTNVVSLTKQTVSSDTSLALAPFSSFSTPPSLKPSSRSVSVQMSSSPSSHIVHRKDVPYVTDSKHTLLPSVLPLDTSTPFRAVQSWTDLHIQRNTLTKKLSHEGLHTFPNKVTVSTSATERIQRPTVIFSSSPSFPLLSTDCQSHDCLPELARNYQTVSVSVDTGLSPDEDEELDRNGNEDEEKLGEAHQAATMVCCCSCDHQCTSCTHNSYTTQHTLGNIPYSLSELEEMMLCLQQFRSVLSNMEEQLSEDQAAVYSALSEQDRENVRDIEELRRAVKQEAGELEMQLNELAHHYGDSLKMKIHRLLDEQSLLCSQLRVFPPGAIPTSSSPAPNS